MRSDLHDLLDDAARRPQRRLDVDDIRRRARRSRMAEIGGAALVIVLLVVGAAVAVANLTGGDSAPIIGDVPETTPPVEETESGDASVPSVTAADLGLDVLVAVDGVPGEAGHVEVHHPDAPTTRLAIEAQRPSTTTIVPDDRGGFVWQSSAGDGGSQPIVHVDAGGAVSVVVEATVTAEDTYEVVGGDGNQILVTHRTGTTPDDMTVDLLAVDIDSGEQRLREEGVAGWESRIRSAVSIEHTVYAMSGEGSSLVVVNRADGDATTVFEGGEPTGEFAVGVARSDDQVFAVVQGEGSAGARLLVIDPFAATVTDTIEVPLTLGTDAEFAVARGISGEASTVLLNRSANEGWLAPLVLDTSDGSWSVLDVEGRALLALPSGADAEPASDCAGADDRANAPPSDGAKLDLYVGCEGRTVQDRTVFRVDSEIEATGDVATDARAVLDRLLGGVATDLEERGYYGLESDLPTGAIGIRSVTFDDGTLTVDFDFPEDGVSNYGTSAGSMVWHRLLAANLLQFEEADRVELRAEGTCEAYSSAFEGEGCRVLTPADAPWNDGS